MRCSKCGVVYLTFLLVEQLPISAESLTAASDFQMLFEAQFSASLTDLTLSSLCLSHITCQTMVFWLKSNDRSLT